MVTMAKEKVNTRFSFPMRLNMAAYLEENLLPGQQKTETSVESLMFQDYYIYFPIDFLFRE